MEFARLLRLRNYRCFTWEHPATLTFDDGFTAFVGQNNSGKSTALRSVYELRTHFTHLFSTFTEQNQFRFEHPFTGVSDPSELANENSPQKFEVELDVRTDFSPPDENENEYVVVHATFEFRESVCRAKKVVAINSNGIECTLEWEAIASGKLHSPQKMIYSDLTIILDYSLICSFGTDLAASRYYPAFRNAINEGGGRYYDLPIGTALVSAWAEWKGGSAKKNKVAISRVEAEIAELLRFKSLQINPDIGHKTFDIIIDGKPHKMYEVGSGVAQLIIVLAAASIDRPPYILIDEPELSLHPSLQLNFLATLASYATKGLLFSTHSVGLARSIAQRIFITRKGKFGSIMEAFGAKNVHFAEILGELSYSGRAELGCDGLLIVEGPTDVLLFQELLRKIGKDGKYVVMQLGGSSLINSDFAIHLNELSRIVPSSKISIFIDSEKTASDAPLAKDRAQFLRVCEKNQVNVKASDRRATENYFDQATIKKVLGERYDSLAPFALLKDSANPWSKSDNWKIARAMDFDVIEKTDLGKFLLGLPESESQC